MALEFIFVRRKKNNKNIGNEKIRPILTQKPALYSHIPLLNSQLFLFKKKSRKEKKGTIFVNI